MTVKWELVKAGETLYDVRRTKMGNTRMSRMASWDVRIISIDHEAGEAMVSWNSNPPKLYPRRKVERLRRKPPSVRERAFAPKVEGG